MRRGVLAAILAAALLRAGLSAAETGHQGARCGGAEAGACDRSAIVLAYGAGGAGHAERALLDRDSAIGLDLDYVAELYRRGNLDYERGEYDLALEKYSRVIRLQPSNPVVWSSRCWVRAIIGQLRQALADCDESLRLLPGDATTLDSRGFVHLRLRQIDAAIADYQAALAATPDRASSLYGRGLARRMGGDRAGGDADMSDAKALDPDIAKEFERYSASGL